MTITFQPWEPYDYSLWGSLSTSLTVQRDEPGVAERELAGGSLIPRSSRDVLTGMLIEQVQAFGGEARGCAKLWVADQPVAEFPLWHARIKLYFHWPISPGQKWKWIVEVPDMKQGQCCGVSVLIAGTIFYRAGASD